LLNMAGPYDYSINIPQPPAQNFLQSLTGIMQLRQMQEQSALQQQQAAIAQQNAAFQQQMQPLQLEAERARIGQIGQATATSAEALRQGKLTFEQAQQDRVRQMEQQAVAQAQQRELVGKFTSLPPNAPMSEIVPIANQLLLLPGGDKVAKQAMENFDALQQEFQKASKTALVTATTQLQAGDVEGAKKTYSTFEQAVRNSGGTNPQLVQLADGIKAQKMLLDLPNDQGVNSAKLAAVQMLSIVDPKAADTILESEKVVVPAKEKQVDEEKRALELEKLRLQNKELEQKLQPGTAPISEKQLADINALTDEAANARITVGGLTNAVDSLLNFAEQKPKEFKTGIKAAGEQFRSFITGETTEAQNLRATIQPFATKEWIAKASGLKGSLSEKEGARLDKGAPDVMKAGAGELLNWMRLVQKVELLDADRKELTAAWQANARSLQSKAPAAFEVANVSVKPGDSYQQTLTKIVAGYKKKSEADIQADAARLKRIQEAEKSGGTPVPNMFNLSGAPQQQQQPATLRPKLISIE
jgi:hypothetical protein